MRALHLLGHDLVQPVVALVRTGAPEDSLDALAAPVPVGCDTTASAARPEY
ncbi:hypothetical protein G3I59_45620 [Amycolatopsis rubida]|uniref:Uncharacterized protein n=1 Tax=Amycolatopsis rubida TaxID=112413 RepID=A0ABX0CB91_9PSEU|nr:MULTISPECIES: hypothetical protein [Amycolatopsis]MYW97701.1 hypothetical protein [Amycolatopsis rubida]NEC62687.1 hypothetical protein [Amycolatopsis rubida]